MQWEFTVVYPRKHPDVAYWWQLHVGQQQEGGALLRLQGNFRYLRICDSDM